MTIIVDLILIYLAVMLGFFIIGFFVACAQELMAVVVKIIADVIYVISWPIVAPILWIHRRNQPKGE